MRTRNTPLRNHHHKAFAFCWLLYKVVTTYTIHCPMVGWLTNNELERIWKEAILANWGTIPTYAGCTWENHEKTVCISADIWMEHLPIRNLEPERFLLQLCVWEVGGSDLGPRTGYTDRFLLVPIPSAPHPRVEHVDNSSISPQLHHSISFHFVIH
jgi:hypothetical protein